MVFRNQIFWPKSAKIGVFDQHFCTVFQTREISTFRKKGTPFENFKNLILGKSGKIFKNLVSIFFAKIFFQKSVSNDFNNLRAKVRVTFIIYTTPPKKERKKIYIFIRIRF